MSNTNAFIPARIYASDPTSPPRVLAAPPKYVQGAGCLPMISRYMSVLQPQRVGVLASARGHGSQAGQVVASLQRDQVQTVSAEFQGECSLEEIARQVATLRDERLDCLVAVGGGKCVDAGKSVAHRLAVPLVVVPTLASNDAPCSAVSVLYTPDGVAVSGEFFPQNPVLVVVDTQVVADAAPRFLVSGMGDAMATWYEARVCMDNPLARNVLGTRPTMAACAMGELCAQTLYADGEAAAAGVATNQVDEALERVVEANTLLSGVGFESGGLAAAHGYAQGFTTVARVEQNYLHGEMVAVGVLSQLMLQQDASEARRVAEFFARVGLPVHLGQLGLAGENKASQDLAGIVEGALAFAPINNLPFPVHAENVLDALLAADELGRDVCSTLGEQAYRSLHLD